MLNSLVFQSNFNIVEVGDSSPKSNLINVVYVNEDNVYNGHSIGFHVIFFPTSI